MNENIYLKIYLSVFIIIISYLSYFVIEKKLKENTKASFGFVIICLLFSSILISFNIKNNGFEHRLKKSEFYKNSQNDISISIRDNLKTFQNKSKHNILIIGNSHSIQTYKGFIINKKNIINLISKIFIFKLNVLINLF